MTRKTKFCRRRGSNSPDGQHFFILSYVLIQSAVVSIWN